MQRKTIRDRILPNKIHKEIEENRELSYTLKTIIRIIFFYLIQSVIFLVIRDYQFLRNVKTMDKHRPPVPQQVIQTLRNNMITENLIIIIITTVISLIIMYYYYGKMENKG